MSEDDTRKIALFHIPKTGGTSLSVYLGSGYAPSRVWQQQRPDEPLPSAKLLANDYDFVSGHISPQATLQFFSKKWVKGILLRSPLTHIPSSFFHIQTKGSAADAELARSARNTTLYNFLAQERTDKFETQFNNPQIRFILGRSSGALDRADVDEAIELLRRINVVGLTERLSSAASMLEQLAGCHPLDILSAHRTSFDTNFRLDMCSSDTIRRLMDVAYFDLELYKQVIERSEHKNTLPEVQPTLISKPIQLASVALSPNSEIKNALVGREFQVLLNDIVLHPPYELESVAKLILHKVMLFGQTCFESDLAVTDWRGPHVRFTIEIGAENKLFVRAATIVGPGQKSRLSIMIPPLNGLVSIILSTNVEIGETGEYGRAEFINPRLL